MNGTSPREISSLSETKQALLEAGEQCFAKRGFHGASVREICDLAGANVAALNYHFGGKMEFYRAVLLTAFDRVSPGWPPPRLTDNPEQPVEQLRRFIRWFTERMLRDTGNNTLRDLIHHELRDPTGVLEVLIDGSMKPISEALEEIVSVLLTDPDPAALRLCCVSIMGQCLIYKQCFPMLERLHGSGLYGPESIEEVAEHIFRFSLAGIQAMEGRGKEEAAA